MQTNAPIKASQIYAVIAASEALKRLEPEQAAKKIDEASNLFKQATSSHEVLLDGLVHQAKTTKAEFLKKYPVFGVTQ